MIESKSTIRMLICTVCPKGCEITVNTSGADVTADGYACRRGFDYAVAEVVNPLRVVTSTVRISNFNHLLPVRTKSAIPKAMIFEIIREIKHFNAVLPVRTGDVLIKNICGTGVDLVSSKEICR